MGSMSTLAGERTRPALHLTPPSGWMNDPYGVHWDGSEYRMFVQAVAGRTSWAAQCTWAMATSPDLVRWTWRGPVLEPQSFETGCWSGSVVPEHGAFYTRASVPDLDLAVVALARWEGDRFVSREDDVLLTPPPGITAFRDPFVVRRDGGWSMVVGAGRADGVGAVLHYRSDDLEHWAYDGEVATIGDGTARTVAECPQLVEVDGRWATIVSVQEDGLPAHVVATSGDGWHRFADGDAAYATTAFPDRDGRPCAISWLRETGDAVDEGVGSWAGAQSLPGTLTHVDGALTVAAHPGLGHGPEADPECLPSAVRLCLDPAATTAVTIVQGDREDFRLAVDHPLDLVLDGDVVEVYGPTYGAWRTPPVHGPRRLVLEGEVPVVHALS
jgi:beta-fructofuranosidase